MSRICPDCHSELVKRDFHGVSLDACPQCAGIFFDEGEVGQVRQTSSTAFEELDALVQPQEIPDPFRDRRTRMCPVCGTAMHPYRYLYSSPIMLDSCEKCGGIWVQNGELHQMAEYVRAGRSQSAPEIVTQMPHVSTERIAGAQRAQRSVRELFRRATLPK